MAWDEIHGHEVAKRLLRSDLAGGRVASAYLLIGPDGIGKRRLALELAMALNCVRQGDASCGHCGPCQQIARGVHPDVHVLAPGGAAQRISIDQVRQALGRAALRPYSARMQVVIVDGADRLTEEAGNSLLKSLEEPSSTTRFVLTTAQPAHCLATILSRCQVLRCQPLPTDDLARIVMRDAHVEPAAARTIARLAGGSASRALALAGRWREHMAAIERLRQPTVAAWVERPLPDARVEVTQLLEDMIGWLRDVAVTAAAPGAPDALLVHAGEAATLRDQAGRVDLDRCLDTAAELMTLRDSLEQFVSTRVVATLAREKWLSLYSTTA